MERETFTVYDSHLKLAQQMCTSWDGGEFGAPSIDCKRPYGNSDVLRDMYEILFGSYPDDDEFEIPEPIREDLHKVHAEMETALQIFLQTASFKTGVYTKQRYGGRWEPTEDGSC